MNTKYNHVGEYEISSYEIFKPLLGLKNSRFFLTDEMIVCQVLNQFLSLFGQFKVTYSKQKDKWIMDELISICV